MPWSTVRIRPATSEDLPVLLGFGEELRDRMLPSVDGKHGGRGRGTHARALDARYLEALADPDRHLVVAVADNDVPIGMAIFAVGPASPLLDVPALHVSHVVVSDRYRRRGAGKALVAAAASYADERGVDQVVVSVNPGSREANRFFARLGFAPLAVRRVAPVSVVRRRLQTADVDTADTVVRRRPRRTVRLRAGVAPLPLGAADPDA